MSLDVRFSRPQVPTIVKRIKEICTIEGLAFEENALSTLVTSLRNDIRSVLNNLQMMSKSNTKFTFDYAKQSNISKTDEQSSVFDIVGKVFDDKNGTTKDQFERHYFDGDMIPLFVQVC